MRAFLLLAFCFASALSFTRPLFAASALATCKGCHTPEAELPGIYKEHPIGSKGLSGSDFQCYACHEYLAKEKEIPGIHRSLQAQIAIPMKKKKTYLGLRELQFSVATLDRKKVPKYHREGLAAFLQAPESRFPFLGESSMYALNKDLIHDLLKERGSELDSTARPARDESLYKKGEELFAKTCNACHQRQGPGPLLRLGQGLLARPYVLAALGNQLPHLQGKMPDFSRLAADEKESLYHYISYSSADREKVMNKGRSAGLLLPQEIYPKVIVPLLSRACRHCHADSAEGQSAFQEFFHAKDEINFLLKRTILGYEPTEDSMKALLPEGASCQSSELIRRLEARRAEWQGHYKKGVVGMPLTLKPIEEGTIQSIRLWVQSGCWKDGKALCSSCAG